VSESAPLDTSRCPLSDLHVTECAHCREAQRVVDLGPPIMRPQVWYGGPPIVEATYSSVCPECWEDIEEGEHITPGLKGWIHEVCSR
jgi:hypothetical protein